MQPSGPVLLEHFPLLLVQSDNKAQNFYEAFGLLYVVNCLHSAGGRGSQVVPLAGMAASESPVLPQATEVSTSNSQL